jgi:hypothetical protein
LTNIESNNYPLSVYAPAANPLCVITSGLFNRLAFELWTMQGRIVAQAFQTYEAP